MGLAVKKRASSSATVYELTVDAAAIAGGFMFLPAIPTDPTKVVVDVVGCGAQSPNVDYVFVGNRILWNAMGLETLLDPGTRIRLIYYN